MKLGDIMSKKLLVDYIRKIISPIPGFSSFTKARDAILV